MLLSFTLQLPKIKKVFPTFKKERNKKNTNKKNSYLKLRDFNKKNKLQIKELLLI